MHYKRLFRLGACGNSRLHIFRTDPIRTVQQGTILKVQEVHEQEMIQMVKQFEATAREKLTDIRELQEAAWLREAELQGLREKFTIQRIALDEKIEEVGNYQVQLEPRAKIGKINGKRQESPAEQVPSIRKQNDLATVEKSSPRKNRTRCELCQPKYEVWLLQVRLVQAGDQYREQQRQLAQLEVDIEVKMEAKEASVRQETEETIKKLCSQLADVRAALQVGLCATFC